MNKRELEKIVKTKQNRWRRALNSFQVHQANVPRCPEHAKYSELHSSAPFVVFASAKVHQSNRAVKWGCESCSIFPFSFSGTPEVEEFGVMRGELSTLLTNLVPSQIMEQENCTAEKRQRLVSSLPKRDPGIHSFIYSTDISQVLTKYQASLYLRPRIWW